MSFTLFGLLVLVGGAFFLRMIILRFWSANSRMMRHLFVTYIGILLMSVAVSYAIPTGGSSDTSHQAYIDAELAAHEVRQSFFEGRLPESKHLIERERWSFRYEEERINIRTKDDSRPAFVLIEKKPLTDDMIHVTYYTTPYVINDYDYTHQVHPPEVMLVEDTIYMVSNNHSKERLRFKRFEQEYYVTPFLSSEMINIRGIAHARGEHLVYIEAPQHVEIIADDQVILEYAGH